MSLQVLVNGFDIANGITHRINWVETTGLFDPVALVAPGAVDTFDGPFRVRQTTVDFGTREVSISGIMLVASPSYADKLRALDGLQAIYAARPSRVVVGTLELLVDFDRVQVAADQLKRLNGMIKYTVTGTAIPSTFSCSHGNGAGQIQGIPVDTQRVNEAAILATMASGVGTITVPGDAPTPAVLTIQNSGPTARDYYLATSATGRRVPISTDANGVGRLDERAGLYLVPGVNRITAYQAATGTTTFTDITVMSFFGTTWRYSGNSASGTATKFDLGPTITTNRTGSARYFRGNTNPTSGGTNGIVTAGDDEPRIGWVWQNRRNIIVNSLNISTGWTSTLGSRTQAGALEPFGYPDNSFSVMTFNDTGTGAIQTDQYALGALGAVSYVASVYILKDSVTSRQAGFFVQISGGNFIAALLNTSTGVAQKSSNSVLAGTVSVTDEGLWWRLSATWTGDGTSNAFNLCPAIAVSGGTATSATATGSAVFASPQVEIGTTPTAYQATDASGISLDHPVNDSGLVLEGNATNVCLYSDDFANAAWTKGSGGILSNLFVAPDGNTVADNLIYDFVTPAIAKAEQTITVTASTTYTFSCWVRSPSGLAVPRVEIENASTAVNYATSTVNVETTWTRISCTGAIPGGVTSIKVRVSDTTTNNLVVWGAQLESGTAATSYIPTVAASALRLADVAGLVSPHNLALYSDTKTNAAWAVTGWSVAATPVAGPVASLLKAFRVTTTATSADNLRQAVTIAGGQAGGKVYTFSVWLRQNATTASVVLHIENQAGTSRGNATATLTTSWQRYLVTATMNAADTDLILKLRTANAAGTIDVYGAQLTEGYLPGRYIRTTDTNVLPVQMIDPSWSQNGYIEADIVWPARTANGNIYSFGEGSITTAGTIIFTTDLSGTSIRFGRYDSTATLRNASVTASTIFNSGTARVRMEWTNYLLSGNRYMMLRLYLNKTLQIENNYAGTAGSSWPIVDVTRLVRLRSSSGDQGTISNLILGTPSLPEGSTAAGI
jgi:hypothetical protein